MPDRMICPLIALTAYLLGVGLTCLVGWIADGQTESRQTQPEQPNDDHQ